MNEILKQAYRQAPWRLQSQWVGLFFVLFIPILVVSFVFLNITSQAANAGLEVNDLNYSKRSILIRMSVLRTELAEARSTTVMQAKAEEMGFVSVEPGTALYISFPGYTPPQPEMVNPEPYVREVVRPILKESYRESLLDWLLDRVLDILKEQGA